MPVEIKRDETMWAEMRPDVYSGPNCDKVRPGWTISADGDMGSDDNEPKLDLRANHFPPGTTVTVSEPLCPKCEERREPIFPIPMRGPLYAGPCRCGFDWDAWVLDNFS